MNSPLQAMRDLLKEDPRYKLESYQFIREALQYAHENLELKPRAGDAEGPNHVTGQQLCESCRRYAVQQYGYMAKVVLGSWGIRSTGDLGDLVYNLIRIEQMRKSDTDRREDFDDVFDFDDAFEPQFEVASRGDDD